MTDQHPLHAPPELVKSLWSELRGAPDSGTGAAVAWTHAVTKAVQWGADQELEACCEWLSETGNCALYVRGLRSERRPSSLKQQALKALQTCCEKEHFVSDDRYYRIILEALESIPE